MYYKQILTRIDSIKLIYQSVRTPENFQLALQTLQREALNLQAYTKRTEPETLDKLEHLNRELYLKLTEIYAKDLLHFCKTVQAGDNISAALTNQIAIAWRRLIPMIDDVLKRIG